MKRRDFIKLSAAGLTLPQLHTSPAAAEPEVASGRFRILRTRSSDGKREWIGEGYESRGEARTAMTAMADWGTKWRQRRVWDEDQQKYVQFKECTERPYHFCLVDTRPAPGLNIQADLLEMQSYRKRVDQLNERHNLELDLEIARLKRMKMT